MAPITPPTDDGPDAIRALLGLRESARAATLDRALRERLEQATRAELIECARLLGVRGRHRMRRAELIERVEAALAARFPEATEPEQADAVHKFDLGRDAEADAPPEHIPWSYGYDRITAMVVDPQRLFVYWEVTDDAIDSTRADLGARGEDAGLALRVYEVTGRIFDGTNALSWVDQPVARTDRRWFFDVGRPCSSACVEIGMLSPEGSFARIARSGRAEFPRSEPVAPGGVEWLTVRTRTGVPGDLISEAQPSAPGDGEPGSAGAVVETPGESFDPGETQREAQTPSSLAGALLEAAPFRYAVESPDFVEEPFDAEVSVTFTTEEGHTRVVYGPWRVVIGALAASGERHVIANWEIRYSWHTTGITPGGRRQIRHVGATELIAVGASERMGASERRGASERVGASERMGASERRAGSRARASRRLRR